MKNPIKLFYPFSRFALLLFVAVGFAACDKDDDDDDDNNTPGVTISEQDRNFAFNATHSNLAEIQLGELALSKAVADSVLDYAQMMVTEHTNAQNELNTIAGNLSIAIPDTIKEEHQNIYDQLSALDGLAFDSAYIHSQVVAHQEAQLIFQTQIDEGTHPSLRNYASEMLPHINMHLQIAIDLQD